MPYVTQDANGNVTASYFSQQYAGQTFLADSDTAIIAFLSKASSAPSVDPLLARVAALEQKVTAIAAVPIVASALNPVVAGS